MPDLKFNCGNCGIEIEADSTLAGKVLHCPKCRNVIRAPEGITCPDMVLGGYVLGRLLGKGGMGEVWLATQLSMKRKVALKILSPTLSKDSEFIARFQQEMKTVAKLDHPGIISAYEAGFDNGFYFFATSFVNGETLESKLGSGMIFEEKEALRIARKVAESLKYAWDKFRLMHRDIKPANIMIEENGDVKLMDMGISKCLSSADKSITMTGSILGTPYYMSPEQARAEKDIDQRTDIYSLGATLYHMLTGHLPYNATSSMGILARVVSENLTSVKEINPRISCKCENLVVKMMEKDKNQRQKTWQEAIEEIDKVMDDKIPDQPVFTPKGKKSFKSQRLLNYITVLSVSIALIMIILLLMGRKKDAAEPSDGIYVLEDSNDVEMKKSEIKKAPAKVEIVPVTEKMQPHKELVVENVKVEGNPISKPEKHDTHRSDIKAATDVKPARTFPGTSSTKKVSSFTATLSEKLGISEEEAAKLVPVVNEYVNDLKQLKHKMPAKGYTMVELRDKVNAVTMKAKEKADKIVTKEQSKKFIYFLEEERRQAFRNYIWRNLMSGTDGK